MDRIKRRRKKKPDKQKCYCKYAAQTHVIGYVERCGIAMCLLSIEDKHFLRKIILSKGHSRNVLLSIVDPWDVKVASVNPVGLAKRRGICLTDIPASRPEVVDHVWPSSRSPVTIPSPWYKPTICTTSLTNYAKQKESNNVDFSSDQPWQRCWSASTQSVHSSLASASPNSKEPSETLKTTNDAVQKKLRVEEYSPPHENGDEKNQSHSNPVGTTFTCSRGLYNAHVHIENEEQLEVHGDRNSERVTKDRNASKRNLYNQKERDHLSQQSEAIDSRSKSRKEWTRVKLDKNCEDILPLSNDQSRNALILSVGETRDSSNVQTNGVQIPSDEAAPGRDRLGNIVTRLVYSRYGIPAGPVTELDCSSQTSTLEDEASKHDNAASLNSEIGELKKSNDSCATVDIGVISADTKKAIVLMPSNLGNMDDAHSVTQKGIASKFSRIESDSSTTFSNSGSTPNGSTLGSETEEDANDEEMVKVPLQAPPRRKTRVVTSSSNHKFGADVTDIPDVQSPNSTITSVNSISSLLKEKLQLSIPQALRSSKKRQNADYKLRAFVGVLFLCVVFLVGFAHVYYTQHVLQRAYFEKFRFNKNERVLRVYNSLGGEIIAARLGVGIPHETGVFPCLPHHQRQEAVCLEWLGQTRLHLAHSSRDDMHCYHVTWQSLSPFFNPEDCFDWSPRRGHWYGAGQIQNMAYPLEQGQLDLSPFITGDIRNHPFGNVLKQYFLNSKGATIVVDPKTPLYVSINANGSKEFCLQAKHDAFAYINHLTALPQLNYTICATDNMKTLHSSMAEKSLWDGLKPEELQAVHTLLSEPVWQISPTNEAAIYNYTEDVIALGFLRQGHVLLNEEWQPNPGDFVLDENRFPSMEETINVIHRRGFKIVFTIQPFISTESINFKDAVANRLLISERGSDPRIPALTRYRQSNSASVLDITNNKTLPWLQTKLETLIKKYHVDSFYLDLGTAHDMPHYYKCEQPLINPDHYKTIFTNAILGSVSVIGVSGAISRPRTPVFVSLPLFPSSWKAIKTVIPTILSYGMIGYPFIMPGSVGGDVALPMSDNNPDNDFEVDLPDKELYVRWLQLSTFLPVIRFTHLPSKYSDESVLEMAKRLTELRQKTVTPLLKKYANETLDTGLPIIRPLWMLDPADPACHVVVDEFSVGEELIVAPVLYSGSRQREVYLPAGVWKDGIDGSLRKGSRWIHNYRVTEDKVAYFVKMPDNTRF